MAVNKHYKFIPQGQSYGSPGRCEIVLDVGGANGGLVFDHHFPGAPNECAAELVIKNKKRIDPSNPENPLHNAEHITIIVHRDPDFDCSAAAWLVTRYLETGKIPDGAEWVVQYASLVDSGKLRIRKEFFLVPASAMYAIYESIPADVMECGWDRQNRWILEWAFELMDWCAEHLATYDPIRDDEQIFNLMRKAPLFEALYTLLQVDRPKYDRDIADDKKTQIVDSFRVYNRVTQRIEEVRAIIYHQLPEARLAKYWARDQFTLTLIPLHCDNRWDGELWRPAGFSRQPNRVIISVPSDSPYSLKELAVQLERAECEVEKRILGDAAELKRTRTVARRGYEDEDWVTNIDPWYDGSSYNHTIVDSPSSHSLLSTERIISIASNHTREDVASAWIDIVCPVLLSSPKDGESRSWDSDPLIAAGWIPIEQGSPGPSREKEHGTYLFDYVSRFLDLDPGSAVSDPDEHPRGAGSSRTKWFRYDSDLCLAKGNGDAYKLQKKQEPSPPGMTIRETRLVLFPSGIGFLIVSVEMARVMSRAIRDVLRGIVDSFPGFLPVPSLFPERYEVKEPVFMVFAAFDGNRVAGLDIGRDIFTICSFYDKNVRLTDGSNERNRMEAMLYRVNAGTIFGFSRNCTVCASIAHTDPSSGEVIESKPLRAYAERLSGPWLYEWILAMHQHWFMITMKTELGLADRKTTSNLSRLRSEFVEFTADCCFSQVSSDPTGAELYNRWRGLLTLDGLHGEVDSQIKALSDNATSSIASMLNLILFIFFPLTLVGLVDYFTNVPNMELPVVLGIVMLLVACLIYWLAIVHISKSNQALRRDLDARVKELARFASGFRGR